MSTIQYNKDINDMMMLTKWEHNEIKIVQNYLCTPDFLW